MVMSTSPIQLVFVWRIGWGFVWGVGGDLDVNIYFSISLHETLPWLFWLRGLRVGVMTRAPLLEVVRDEAKSFTHLYIVLHWI
mgnify:CR=1 FL=1